MIIAHNYNLTVTHSLHSQHRTKVNLFIFSADINFIWQQLMRTHRFVLKAADRKLSFKGGLGSVSVFWKSFSLCLHIFSNCENTWRKPWKYYASTLWLLFATMPFTFVYRTADIYLCAILVARGLFGILIWIAKYLISYSCVFPYSAMLQIYSDSGKKGIQICYKLQIWKCTL